MKNNHSRIASALAVGCALAIVATSCSSGSTSSATSTSSGAKLPSDTFGRATGLTTPGDPSSPTATPDSTSASSPSDSTASSDSSGDTSQAEQPYVSPLDKFLGYGGQIGNTAEQDAESAQQEQQVQDLVATCMQMLGFSYVPYVPDYSSSGFDLQWTMDPGDFARQYGYGMTTIDYSGPSNPDPNEATVTAMSPAQRSAYYKALYGPTVTVDENGDPTRAKDGPAPQASTDGSEDVGCLTPASEAVYGSTQDKINEDNAAAPIEASISALYDSIETDERVGAATATWIGCMSDAGHPGYTEKTDAPIDVSDRASTLRGDAEDFTDVDPTALQELREYEISVATADYECGLAYDATHHAVQTEKETTFIDENRAALEEYRDALAAGTAGHG